MCVLCAQPGDDGSMARREHVLQLLALVEHPDALPRDAALRVSREIMALMQAEPGLRRCEAVSPADVTRFQQEPNHASR